MSLRTQAAWAAAASVVVAVSRFMLLAILSRKLDLVGFGRFAYVQWLIDISFLVAALGTNGAASRYLAELSGDIAKLARFIRIWLPFAVLLPCVGAVIASVIALYRMELHPGEVAYLILWGLSNGVWAMQTAALSGLQRFDLIFAANSIAAIIMIVGASMMTTGAADVTQVYLVMTLSCLTAFVVGVRELLGIWRRVEPSELVEAERRSAAHYALNIWITALLWNLVWSRGEVPLVREYLGDAALARYSVALTLLGGAISGVMLGVSGVAPQVTRYHGDGRVGDAVSICRRVGDWQLLICSCAALALIWLGPELLQVAFGKHYVDSRLSLCLLALGLPAMSLSMHNHLLQVRTNARFNRNSTLAGLFILVASAMLLVPAFGIEGAAAARAATMLVLAAVSLFAFATHFGSNGIGLRNLLVVACIYLLSITLLFALPQLQFTSRIPILVVSWLVLFALIRDESGSAALMGLWRVVGRR